MLRHLPRVVSEPGPRPDAGLPARHPMRQITRDVAADPGTWTTVVAAQVAAFFDGLAAEWHTRDGPYRRAPVEDAFARGGPIPTGTAVEVGSGTGLLSQWLAARFDVLVALDLSFQMLRLAPAGPASRLQADAARLPLRAGVLDAVVLVNALLFAREANRVLKRSGAIVWVTTRGPDTPIYLSAEEVEAALPGEWDGLASEAAFGTWAVFRRR